jgi:hypothetical protein
MSASNGPASASNGPARDRPATLPIIQPQPEPQVWLFSFMPGRDGGVTAITRFWESGDTRRCRLCPKCTALHDLNACQVQARGEVDELSVPLFSMHGRHILTADSSHDRVIRPLKGDAVG